MTITSTVIADTPDYTLTRIVDDVANCTTQQVVYKSGSQGFNIQQMQAKMAAALSALESADVSWATLSAANKDNANHLAVRCTAKLIRFALGQFDAN